MGDSNIHWWKACKQNEGWIQAADWELIFSDLFHTIINYNSVNYIAVNKINYVIHIYV